MAAVWVILAKTRFSAELIESSPQAGVRTVSVPFEITAQFIPDLIRQTDKQLEKAATELASAAEFSDIIYKSPQMQEIIEQAQIVAIHDVPVLIEGEFGTGKELFAKAIHRSGSRKDKLFVAVNCGAIPSELIESELFGHVKGAFTGATNNRQGYFEEADGGTIFLDEIGELPLRAQVRLLRVLQEKQITQVGTNTPKTIDVRIISATNRNLLEEVSKGNFREDLFYRLAVFPLYLPPLREREGDLTLLIKNFLEKLNQEYTGRLWKTDKFFDFQAEKVLLNNHWTGNVRELQNTILRLCILTKESRIAEKDVNKALLAIKNKIFETILNRPLSNEFSLPEILGEVARHYL
jgi:transcriptional regulator with GAF, ATPase, and Fis domain